MKRRMESNIIITYFIMIVVAVIISGLYSVISMKSSFFTSEVLAEGLLYASAYLLYIWICSRKHQLLATIGVLGIGFMICLSFSSEGVAVTYADINWKHKVMFIYCCTACFIALYQGSKLREEDGININSNITDNNKPEIDTND